MPLLALNTLLPQSIRVKYQLAIGILPIGLVFSSFLPMFLFASWLAAYLGIPVNSPLKEHPNAGVWIAVCLLTMVTLLIVGYAIGWVINAAVARYIFGWSKEEVRSVYLHSNLPPHWLKEGAATSKSIDAQSIAKWETERKVGALRFIAVRGVLSWGGPMFLAMYLAPTVIKGQGFSMEVTLFSIALWVCAGACFGAIIWYNSEANYRKLKQRSEA